jgi:predicted type IV restriction endonuclease
MTPAKRRDYKPASWSNKGKNMAAFKDKKTGKLYGVSAEARRLGVSKGHLWLVLNNQRQSKRLMKRVEFKEVK